MDLNAILVMRSMLIYQAKEILSATKDGKKEVREQEEEGEAGEKERSQLLGQRQTAAAIGQVVCGGEEERFARSSRECRDLLGECSLNNESQTWAAGMVSHSQITALRLQHT